MMFGNISNAGNKVDFDPRGVYSPAYLLGGSNAESDVDVWSLISDGEFSISIDGVDYDITSLDFTSIFTPDFLTGGTNAESTAATWAAITDGEFSISINGTAYDITGIDFSGDLLMSDVAATLQAAIRAETSALETVVWSTDHFIISSVDDTVASEITVASTYSTGTGTDISGISFMDCDSTNGVVTDRAALMSDIATIIETAIQTETSSTETVVWSTDHFIISSVDATSSSAISLASTYTAGSGTDISVVSYLDCDSTNGKVYNAFDTTTDIVNAVGVLGITATGSAAMPAMNSVSNAGYQIITDGTNYIEVSTDGSAVKTKGIMLMGDDGANARNIHTDSDGDVQVDILSSTLPTGAATEATLADVKTATEASATDLAAIEVLNTTIAGDTTSLDIKEGTTGEASAVDGTRAAQLRYVGEKIEAARALLATIDGDTSNLDDTVSNVRSDIQAVDDSVEIVGNKLSNVEDGNFIIGKSSGNGADFTVAYLGTSTLTLGMLPDGSYPEAIDIERIRVIDDAGDLVEEVAANSLSLSVTTSTLSISGFSSTFQSDYEYVIFTNIPRLEAYDSGYDLKKVAEQEPAWRHRTDFAPLVSAQDLTGTEADFGSSIAMDGYNTLTLAITKDCNDSEDVDIYVYGQTEAGGDIFEIDGIDVKRLWSGTGTDGFAMYQIVTGNGVPFIQLKAKAGTVGSTAGDLTIETRKSWSN